MGGIASICKVILCILVSNAGLKTGVTYSRNIPNEL